MSGQSWLSMSLVHLKILLCHPEKNRKHWSLRTACSPSWLSLMTWPSQDAIPVYDFLALNLCTLHASFRKSSRDRTKSQYLYLLSYHTATGVVSGLGVQRFTAPLWLRVSHSASPMSMAETGLRMTWRDAETQGTLLLNPEVEWCDNVWGFSRSHYLRPDSLLISRFSIQVHNKHRIRS